MKETVLFITHTPKQCGVYEFGKNVFKVISQSNKYFFAKAECQSLEDLKQAVNEYKPVLIIYNYHPDVLPWLCTKVSKGIYRNNISGFAPIQIGIIHEVTQKIADTATAYRNKWILGQPPKKLNSLFDFYIAPDPTLLLKNPLVFKTGRLIEEYTGEIASPSTTTFGSFGFATPKKGFEKIVEKVQKEFDEAIIRINMPSADFGDKTGEKAIKIAENCRAIINKPGIKLEISHQFMDSKELHKFLASNSMNVFLYEDTGGRGLSSAVDNALSVKKPIAISRCPMFRHLLLASPSICVEDASLKEILSNGFDPLKEVSKDWTKDNLLWEYERIVGKILRVVKTPKINKMGIVKTMQSTWRRFFSMPDKSFTWLRNTDTATEDHLSIVASSQYTATQLAAGIGYNRILNDQARELYASATEKLFELVPKTMSKKIARANIQQAFVFDTVVRFIKTYNNPKLLCVGSYEDTASMALQRMGYEIEEIDPMINYYLQEFYTKPSTIKNSYDIIFSTSVIEHDPDDESFIKCIDGLLAPNGIAVITCDYKDGWKQGDLKPEVDARFYTKNDLEQRLLSYIPNCELVDTPHWDCPYPDFTYLGKYHYSFASFVFRKKSN